MKVNKKMLSSIGIGLIICSVSVLGLWAFFYLSGVQTYEVTNDEVKEITFTEDFSSIVMPGNEENFYTKTIEINNLEAEAITLKIIKIETITDSDLNDGCEIEAEDYNSVLIFKPLGINPVNVESGGLIVLPSGVSELDLRMSNALNSCPLIAEVQISAEFP